VQQARRDDCALHRQAQRNDRPGVAVVLRDVYRRLGALGGEAGAGRLSTSCHVRWLTFIPEIVELLGKLVKQIGIFCLMNNKAGCSIRSSSLNVDFNA
jgi:hypothetical protein